MDIKFTGDWSGAGLVKAILKNVKEITKTIDDGSVELLEKVKSKTANQEIANAWKIEREVGKDNISVSILNGHIYAHTNEFGSGKELAPEGSFRLAKDEVNIKEKIVRKIKS